jgi:hypothetical protein
MHPGETLKSGKGHSRVYVNNEIYAAKSDKLYDEASKLALQHSDTFFGIKGPSVLQPILKITSQVWFDPLHMLYEGVTKQLLCSFFDSENSSEPFYLGRKFIKDGLNAKIAKIQVPSNFNKFLSLNYFAPCCELRNVAMCMLLALSMLNYCINK